MSELPELQKNYRAVSGPIWTPLIPSSLPPEQIATSGDNVHGGIRDKRYKQIVKSMIWNNIVMGICP